MIARGDPLGYYARLDLPLTATPEEIRRAFNERAKQMHPDRNRTGGDAASFHAIVEAYDVLRDPLRRLRYDADSVEMSRDDGASAAAERPALDPLAQAWAPGQLWLRADDLRRRLRIPHMAMPAAMAGLIAFMLLASVWWGWRQHELVAVRDERIAALTVAAEQDRADLAEAQARYQAASRTPLPAIAAPGAGPAPSIVYQNDIALDAQAATLGDEARRRLRDSAAELATFVKSLPAERTWRVVVREQAASARGDQADAAASAWSRLNGVADFLTQVGVPRERIVVRLERGAPFDPPPAASAAVVGIEAWCCYQMTGAGRGGG